MSEHKIEREAVLWAWKALYQDVYPDGPSEHLLGEIVKDVLAGAENSPVVQIAIAYVEAAKNHIDTVLELETNLARATEELVSLRTIASHYRLADYNQRRYANTGTTESYRKAAEALDKALGGPGAREASCTPDQ